MSQKVKIIFKKDTFSLVFEENGFESRFFVFDYECKLNLVFEKGKTYRVGFDNSIICFDVDGFKFLNLEDVNSFVRRVYEETKGILKERDFEVINLGYKIEREQQVIDRFVLMDCDKIFSRAEEFKKLVGHVPILPPDQYMSLYIPLTVGCSYNKCSFCNLYKDRNFRIRTEEEVRDLTKKILDLFGRSLLTRRGIFLGEGNVFVEKTDKILDGMKIIKEVLGTSSYINFDINNSFFGFMDTFHTVKSVEELRSLKNEGVRRVYIGLESGDEFILNSILFKPSDSEKVLKTVDNLKTVGINLGIIVLVGVGGKDFRDRHFENTVRLIEKMSLEEGDIIYLSPMVEYLNLDYYKILNNMKVERMSYEEIENETINFKKEFSRFRGVKVVIYRVDRFLYA